MSRRVSPEKQLELDSLYRVVAVIAEWLDEHMSEQLRGQWLTATRKAYSDGDLRGIRMMYNDLVEMTNEADAQERRVLDGRLRARAGTNLEILQVKMAERIERIRKRGKLTSEEQYYLVREHVEFIFDTPGRSGEVEQLLTMMNDFEERSAARTRSRAPATASDDAADTS
jgi:hypothetical protein